MREFKTIKAYADKNFEVEMYQDSDTDKYRITYKTKNSTSQASEWIQDFSTASFLFDMKIDELRGQ